MVDLLKLVNLNDGDIFPISASDLVEIIKMVEDKKINKTIGLQLLDEVIESGEKPGVIAKKRGYLVTIDDSQIVQLLTSLKNQNPKVVEDYRQNPEKVEAFIVGFVMKNTQGKADSIKTREIIRKMF